MSDTEFLEKIVQNTAENFNSGYGFREFDKNKDDFYPATRVGSNAKA